MAEGLHNTQGSDPLTLLKDIANHFKNTQDNVQDKIQNSND
jgi:hypothetical protein